MWNFATKRNALRERMLLAPETNPSEFVRRYLAQKQKSESKPLPRTESQTPAFEDRSNRIQRLIA
jgi:hypothetical protein